MTENAFWLGFNAVAATVICTVVVSMAVNIHYTTRTDLERVLKLQQAKLDAIKAGADPLAVSCAFDGAGQLCSVLVAKKLQTP